LPRKYLAFDIEIVKSIPDTAQEWKSFRPLGISCAATLTGEGQLDLWYGVNADGKPADGMDRDGARRMVTFLQEKVQQGYTLLTWNGLGFDFDILAEESGMGIECCDLALDHVDMMFHIFCLKGFGVGLDKAAKGMGLSGKLAGMDGSMAPKYWAAGKRQEVLDYVAQDVRTTLDLAREVEKQRQLTWIDRKGLRKNMDFQDGWLTVRQALKLPIPDTSYMQNPWKRSKFTGWLDKIPGAAQSDKTKPTQETLF
jgi:hypothetical protein